MKEAPAIVRTPARDIKLLFVNDRKERCTYSMMHLINRGSIRLIDIVRKFKPDIQIPDDPLYHQVRRHVIALQRLGYVTLEKRSRIDWERTERNRTQEIAESVHNIFLAAFNHDPPPPLFPVEHSGEGSPPTFPMQKRWIRLFTSAQRLIILPC
jgi:hypothetical protein